MVDPAAGVTAAIRTGRGSGRGGDQEGVDGQGARGTADQGVEVEGAEGVAEVAGQAGQGFDGADDRFEVGRQAAGAG